jgi:hypothetical protein
MAGAFLLLHRRERGFRPYSPTITDFTSVNISTPSFRADARLAIGEAPA